MGSGHETISREILLWCRAVLSDLATLQENELTVDEADALGKRHPRGSSDTLRMRNNLNFELLVALACLVKVCLVKSLPRKKSAS